jgi:hypothetical protein
VTGAAPIRVYGASRINGLLTALAFDVHRAARSRGTAEIRDLEASLERFEHGLQLFSALFPKPEARKIRKRLRRAREAAAQVSERDFAIEFLSASSRPLLLRRLREERKLHAAQLASLLKRWSAHDFSAKWRAGLALQ